MKTAKLLLVRALYDALHCALYEPLLSPLLQLHKARNDIVDERTDDVRLGLIKVHNNRHGRHKKRHFAMADARKHL